MRVETRKALDLVLAAVTGDASAERVQRKMIGELCEHQPPGIHGLFPAKNPVAGSQTNSLQFKSVTAGPPVFRRFFNSLASPHR